MERMNQYIRSIELLDVPNYSRYPFSLDAVKSLKSLELHPNVTFIVGENGSGKSTLLEGVAIAYGFNPEGGSKNFTFSTADSHSVLSRHIKLSKGIVLPKDGYFLRAESFYNVASNIDQMDKYGGFGPPIIESYGGTSLHKQSHGESFMSLLLNRFGGHGVYILDEPEAALSPMRQLAMLRRIYELVGNKAQFIIATHSPILMAYPDAIIYSVDGGLHPITYEETDHYQIMKQFIESKDSILNHLFKEES